MYFISLIRCSLKLKEVFTTETKIHIHDMNEEQMVLYSNAFPSLY